MYKTISGILRIFLAVIAGKTFYSTCNNMQVFQKYSTMSYGAKVGTIMLFVFIINFVVYMIVNGIRELHKKPIKLIAMYYIIGLTYLLIGLIVIPSSHIDSNISYFSLTMMVTIFSLLLAVYYLFADFIAFFVKRKSKRQS
jgi:uncharacterized membrane protein